MTMWSYCSQIQRREQSAGPPIRLFSVSRMALGAGTHSGRISFGATTGNHGRWYSGAELASVATGMSASTRPLWRTIMRPVSVVSPMTAKSRPHFLKIAAASASAPGFSTMSMRSWLSDSIIS